MNCLNDYLENWIRLIYEHEKLVDLTKSKFDVFSRVLLEVKDYNSKVYDPRIKLQKFIGLGTPKTLLNCFNKLKRFQII